MSGSVYENSAPGQMPKRTSHLDVLLWVDAALWQVVSDKIGQGMRTASVAAASCRDDSAFADNSSSCQSDASTSKAAKAWAVSSFRLKVQFSAGFSRPFANRCRVRIFAASAASCAGPCCAAASASSSSWSVACARAERAGGEPKGRWGGEEPRAGGSARRGEPR